MLLYVKLPFTGCHVIRTVDCSELPPKHAATFEIPYIAYGGIRDMCCSDDNLFVTAKYEMEVFSYNMKRKMVLWHFKFVEFRPVLVGKSNESCFTTEKAEASELQKGPVSPLKSEENYLQSLSKWQTWSYLRMRRQESMFTCIFYGCQIPWSCSERPGFTKMFAVA